MPSTTQEASTELDPKVLIMLAAGLILATVVLLAIYKMSEQRMEGILGVPEGEGLERILGPEDQNVP